MFIISNTHLVRIWSIKFFLKLDILSNFKFDKLSNFYYRSFEEFSKLRTTGIVLNKNSQAPENLFWFFKYANLAYLPLNCPSLKEATTSFQIPMWGIFLLLLNPLSFTQIRQFGVFEY